MTTVTPHEIKLGLERLCIERELRIVGLHSIVLVDGKLVDAVFDIEPDPVGCGLHYQFSLPKSVGRDDLNLFALWLISPDYSGETRH